MPELPEVETLCRQLRRRIVGKQVIKTVIWDEKLAPLPDGRGKTVRDVRRLGKMLCMQLDDGNYWLIHLRMTGRLLLRADAAVPLHARWQVSFENQDVFLVDPRRFATIKVTRKRPDSAGAEIFGDFHLENWCGDTADAKLR